MKNLLLELKLAHKDVEKIQLKIVKYAVDVLKKSYKREIELSVYKNVKDNYYWIFLPDKIAYTKKIEKFKEQINEELNNAEAKFYISYMPQTIKEELLYKNLTKKVILQKPPQ